VIVMSPVYAGVAGVATGLTRLARPVAHLRAGCRGGELYRRRHGVSLPFPFRRFWSVLR
jgi:hypothetical protein